MAGRWWQSQNVSFKRGVVYKQILGLSIRYNVRYGIIVCIFKWLKSGSPSQKPLPSFWPGVHRVQVGWAYPEHSQLLTKTQCTSEWDGWLYRWKRTCCPCCNVLWIVFRVQVHDLQDILGVDREKMEVAELFSVVKLYPLYIPRYLI